MICSISEICFSSKSIYSSIRRIKSEAMSDECMAVKEFGAKKIGTPHLKLLVDKRSWDNTFSAGGKTSALDKEVTFDQRNKDADTYPLTKDKK